MGCSGSRKFAGIKPEEVIVGMNGENIGCIVDVQKVWGDLMSETKVFEVLDEAKELST